MSCVSDSEPVDYSRVDNEKLMKRLMVLEREKEDWMQKYFALLAERESDEVKVAEELSTLETDVQTLSHRILDLTTDKKDLTDTVSSLMAENSRLQADLSTQQQRWDDEMKALKRALTREREACSYELSAIGEQFVKVREQFESYKVRMGEERTKKAARKLSSTIPGKKMRRTLSTDRGRLEYSHKLPAKPAKSLTKRSAKE